jgi:hypothetical protein
MGFVGLPKEVSVPSGWFIAARASPNLSKLCLVITLALTGTQRGSARHITFLHRPPKNGKRALKSCLMVFVFVAHSLYFTSVNAASPVGPAHPFILSSPAPGQREVSSLM